MAMLVQERMRQCGSWVNRAMSVQDQCENVAPRSTSSKHVTTILLNQVEHKETISKEIFIQYTLNENVCDKPPIISLTP